MKRNVLLTVTALMILGAMLCFPSAGFAKRGLPDYVVESSCGDNGTAVLIAIGTKYGRTFKIAERISEILCQDGFQVDIRFVKDVTEEDLSGYDAVILGSCIYIEHWHEDAIAFLDQYESALAAKNVAYYCVNALLGMTNIPDAAEMVDKYYIQPMYEDYPEISPLDIGAFAGAINYRILLWYDWFALRMMLMPGGDWTDWEAVDDWGEKISGMLQ